MPTTASIIIHHGYFHSAASVFRPFGANEFHQVEHILADDFTTPKSWCAEMGEKVYLFFLRQADYDGEGDIGDASYNFLFGEVLF